MANITIWTLESDYDRDVVKCLADKLVVHPQLGNISIRAVGKTAIPKQLKGQKDPDAAIKRKVELYLKEDACVIFVLDKDGPMASHQRQHQPNSLINQVRRVMKHKEFSGRVHLAYAVQVKHPPKEKLYKENQSPKIAEHVEINDETLRRNASLGHLFELIKQCGD